MISDQSPKAQSAGSIIARGIELTRDFAAYAGRKGVAAAILVGSGAILDSVSVLLLIPALSIVVHTAPTSSRTMAAASRVFEALGAESRLARLAVLLAVFLFLVLLRAAVHSLRDVTLARLQIGFVAKQRMEITQRLAGARWDVIARLRHARIIHMMSADIASIGAATSFLMQSIVSVTMLISQCILAFLLSPLLASFALVALAIGGLAFNSIIKRADAMGRYAINTNLRLTDNTAQFLGGLKLAISQNLQDSYVDEFNATLNGLIARQIGYMRRRTNARLAGTVLVAFVSALAVLVGFGVLDVAPSLLIAVLYLLTRMSGPAMQISQGAQQVAISLPAYEKVKDLLRELGAAKQERNASGAQSAVPDGAIVFRAVGFSHLPPEDSSTQIQVLKDINLRIEPGSFIGIAGASGAGKTTLADLLAGLFPPQGGEISVGGEPLRGALLDAWRRRISYVSQDPFLFHDTIRRNLLWAAPEASEEELWNALGLAGAGDLVRRMEHGLETIVGERGTLVSGGERQRLALARAVLRRPHLLILDEATNAIDIASEHMMLKELIALRPRPTIVMIAHRQESVALCERVVVLEDGRIAEG